MEGNELYNSEEEPGNWSGNKASELCRVCACPNTYLIPIFEGEGLENELAMKIQKHLPIQVLELDGLPNHMCYQCASTLIAWHDLAMGCVEADNKLREWQREEQLQLQDNGEDKDDKSSEFYDTPSLESELPDIDTTKSKEPDLSTPEMQTKTLKKKIVITKVKERPSERSTIKMTIAKNPTAGPSGYTSKSQVVEELKTLEGSTQEFGVTKRYQQPPLSSFYEFQQVMYTPTINSSNFDTSSMNGNFVVTRICKNNDSILELRGEKMTRTSDQSIEHNHDSILIDTGEQLLMRSEEERAIFECDYCGRKMASRENIIVHLRIHTGEKPFTCRFCGKQFRVHSGIKRHIREVHEGIKDKFCDICGRGFANKRTLEDHERVHTGERPFVCDVCGKTFKTKAALYVHNRSHTDIFPFNCTLCEKRFRTQGSLSFHVLLHTGEKPHACDSCTKCFRDIKQLRRHKLIHSEEKPFSCEKCTRSFRQKKYLKNHDKIHHMKCNELPSVSNIM